MKNLLYILISFLSLGFHAALGQKTYQTRVSGNCGQCQERIESAAKSITGVNTANWKESEQKLYISYSGDSVTVIPAVHQALQKVGHDTEWGKAPDKSYRQLPECCRYERSSSGEPIKSKTQHLTLHIEGMTCEDGCAKGIEMAVYRQKGVKSSTVDFSKERASIVYDPSKISKEELIRIVESFHGDDGKRQYKAAIIP